MTTSLLRRALPALLALSAALQACNCGTNKVDLCKNVVCTADSCHTAGTCNAATGLCSAPAAVADGTSCSDGNACNGQEVCTAGVCAVKAGTAVTCNSPPACHTATGAACAPATGQCTYPNLADGAACDDADKCNGHEVCTAGVCAAQAGSAVVCNAPPACHTADGATCAPATGLCTYPAAAEGTACDDGNGCTLGDACHAGACAPGAAKVCAASDQCHTAGTCNPATGACSNPAAADGTACSDGNACTLGDACHAGACTPGAAKVCAASDQCHTAGTCDPATGACSNPAAAEGTPCTDGNACTLGDACHAGACTPGAAKVCAASDQCHTAGTCDPATGACSNPAAAEGAPCTDGNACTVGDACHAGACAPGAPKVCAASDQCHSAGTCNPATGACSNPAVADGTGCDDGSACTTGDTCQAGACTGAAVACNAPGACHVTDGAACNPANGSCSYPAAPDGSACSFDGQCAGTPGCKAGVCSCLVGTVGVRLVTPGGAPVAGAKVTWVETTATTDADGIASLQITPGGRAVLQISAQGFAASSLVLAAVPAASFGSTVYLLPRAFPLLFSNDQSIYADGYAWPYPRPAYNPNGTDSPMWDSSVDLPSSSLVDGAGQPPATQVTLSLTSLDPTGPQRRAAPGPFRGVPAPVRLKAPLPAGDEPIEAAAMVEVEFSAGGSRLFLNTTDAGLRLHLRLPASMQAAFRDGDSYDLWLYDPAAGVWNERSDVLGAILVSNQPPDNQNQDSAAPGEGILEWRGYLPETGWWALMLPRPDLSCVQAQVVRASDGTPVPLAAVHASGVDWVGTSFGRTGPAGEPVCLEFPVGKRVAVTVDDPFLAAAPEATVTVTGAAGGAACGAGPCAPAVIKVADLGCVRGKVVDGSASPVANGTVTVTSGKGFSARSARVVTGSDGSWCAAVPAGTALRLSALNEVADSAAQGTVTTGAGAAACSADACTAAADLVVAPIAGQKICLKGRIWEWTDPSSLPLDGGLATRTPAAGQTIWVFERNGGAVNPVCPDPFYPDGGTEDGGPLDPPISAWLTQADGFPPPQLLAQGVAGPDGRFCLDVPPPQALTQRVPRRPAGPRPLDPVNRELVVVPGDCDIRRRGIAFPDQRGSCAVDPITPDPADEQRLCEIENCIDIGDFDYAFLYSGSGCHR